MSDLKENLAWLLHDIWAGEMAFVFGKYLSNVEISDMQELVNKINSPYDNLSGEDKKHYEDQARRIIKVFEDYIEKQE